MQKRGALKIFAVIITVVILMTMIIPGQAFSWSAIWPNNTHQAIDAAAYAIISADPAFRNVKFPSLADIQNNDYVQLPSLTGTGPDVVGQSNCSDHYYNPRLTAHQTKAGGGPDAVKAQYTQLVAALTSGNAANTAHAASWTGHYAADVNVPYHTQGTYRSDIMKIYNAAGGASAATVPLPEYIFGTLGLHSHLLFGHSNDFKAEIEAWLAASVNHTATEDWFDPWYWDGGLRSKESSSHVVYEADSLLMPGNPLDIFGPGAVSGYSDLWVNPTPSFSNPGALQAANVGKFATTMAGITQTVTDEMDGSISSTIFISQSIQTVATVWRASFSGLSPAITASIPDKNEPQKFKVQGTITNTAGASVHDTQLKLTVTGGSIQSGDKSPVIGYIDVGGQKTYTWEVEAAQLGYCTMKLEVIGKYYDAPDLQYAVTQTSVPGVIPVATTDSGRWNHSMVFCLDNSGSMQGQPIQDAMNAGVKAVIAAPSGPVEMALYFFGTNGCDPPVRKVDFTVNRDTIKAAMMTATATGNTPLAAAITAAGNYIKSSAQGAEATIILLTDGMETCSGDPIAAARALNPNLKLKSSGLFAKPAYAASSTPIKLQVIGFNIDSTGTEAYLKQVAEAGNGNYYPATGLDELVDALEAAVKDATGGGFEFQTWWFITGGVLLLFFIVMMTRRGKRTPAPAMATATASNVAPPQRVPVSAPGANIPPQVLFCPDCGAQIQRGAAFCSACGKPASRQGPAFCPKCGTPATAGSAFCNKCGTPLPTTTTQPAGQKRFCSRCGTERRGNKPFCSACGNRFSS